MKKLLIGIIKFYKKRISPLTAPCCRFSPSCSQYAIDAVERFGAFRGSWLALKRILRCNPFVPGGYDPVQDKINKVKKIKKKRNFKKIKYKK